MITFVDVALEGILLKFDQSKLTKSIRTQEKKHTILIVDDEPQNIKLLRSILSETYHMLEASDGMEALEVLESTEDSEEIHLIITDQRMPRVNGIEFLERSLPMLPHAMRIILTGYTDMDVIIDAFNKCKIYKYVNKPFDYKDFEITVVRALEAFDLETKNRHLIQTFEKFVPKQFHRRVKDEGIENIRLGKAETDEVSILFSDIRSFTTLSEKMNPQELLNFFNAFFNRMNGPIHLNNGFVDKFIGDAIMAVFDNPGQDDTEEAKDAINAAIEMHSALGLYNVERLAKGYKSVEVGIGIHSGPVVIGTVGSKDRMDYTALGDTVNLASRIEGLTKTYDAKIIVSGDTHSLVKEEKKYIFRPLDYVCVLGREDPIRIYEVLNSDDDSIQEKKIQTMDSYLSGLEKYYAKKWDEALVLFQECLKAFPEDSIAKLFLERTLAFQKDPPEDSWEGSVQLDFK